MSALPKLSVRAVNALARARITTRESLVRWLPLIYTAAGIGPKTRREILRSMGLDEGLTLEGAREFSRREAASGCNEVRP